MINIYNWLIYSKVGPGAGNLKNRFCYKIAVWIKVYSVEIAIYYSKYIHSLYRKKKQEGEKYVITETYKTEYFL